VLERRVERDGVFHLSPEDELIHLVVHNFLRKGRLRSSSLAPIRQLLSMPLDRQYIDEHLDAFGLKAAFQAAASWIARDEPNLEKAAQLRKYLFRAVLRARTSNLWRHLLLGSGLMPASRRRGGLVALIGPDGCGKSTIVKTLMQRARVIPNLKIETTYLGPWGQMQLSLVPALRRFGITPRVQSPDASEATRTRLGSTAKGYVFYAALYIELVYRYVTSVFFRVRRGRWVLADRYITDLRYLYKERPIGNYETVRRLLCRFFPKPDLLIVLDNLPEVIVSRKPQFAASQIETLRRFNLKVAQSYRFEVVTTDRSPEEVADHVLNRMLSMRAVK
jgi:thymidylate kinase